jgi:hypothetical protein
VVFVEMATPTMGAANSGPNVGPVVISEVMYNRPGTNQQGEFIELHNITNETVDFNHPTVVGNTWLIIDAVQFRFPQGVSLEAGGYLLIVGGNPETYRTQYNVPDNVQIFGPYSGLLSNTGEGLELSKPGDPEPTGEIPYYRMDYVEYSPLAPWPTEANGGGATLTRINDGAFGDDVVNWKASAQPGGTPGRPNDYVEVPGDTNDDGRVDITDLNNVRNHFGDEGPNVVGDANGDNRVDIADLNAVRNHFGNSAPAPVTASSAAIAVVEQDRDAAKKVTTERNLNVRNADVLAVSRTAAAPVKKQRLVAWDEALRAMTLS